MNRSTPSRRSACPTASGATIRWTARDIPVNSAAGPGQTGIVTFGCLNNFCKINDGVLALWAQVLRQVEKLPAAAAGPRAAIGSGRWISRRSEGIDPGRVEIRSAAASPAISGTVPPHRPGPGQLSLQRPHHQPRFSFWMGVPVVTLVGQTRRLAGRVVPVVEPGPDGTGRDRSRTVRADRGRTGQGSAATGGTAIDPAPADGAIAADGRPGVRPQHRGGISPDVAAGGASAVQPTVNCEIG